MHFSPKSASILTSAVALALSFLGTQAYATPDDTRAVTKIVGFSGSGCSLGSDSPDSDWYGTASLRFTNFTARVGSGTNQPNKDCRIQANVRANGKSYRSLRVGTIFMNYLGDGAQGRIRQVVNASGIGSSSGRWHTLTAADNSQGQGQLVDEIPLRNTAPASANVTVTLEIQITRKGSDQSHQTQIQISSTDIGIGD